MTSSAKPKGKILNLVGVLIAGMAVIYTVYWFSLAQGLKATFVGWLEARAAIGQIAEVGGIKLSGFPTAIALRLDDLSLGGDDGKGAAWSWKAASARIESAPWQPQDYRLDLSGKHDLHLSVDGEVFAYKGVADQLSVEATLGFDGFPEQATMRLRGLALSPVNNAPPLSLAGLMISMKKGDDKEPLKLSLELEDFKGPNLAGSPFGGDYKRVVIKGRQIVPLPYCAH